MTRTYLPLAFGLIAHVLGQGQYIDITHVGDLSLKDLGCPIFNDFNYHSSKNQSIRSFQGVFGSNFNETITICDFKVKQFELNDWKIVPVLGQSADSGQPRYNEKGAMLTGGTFLAPNGSVVWKGFGFSANGPYDFAFALSGNGSEAYGYYTFLNQFNASTPGGETGPWILYYKREPTREECALVYRDYKCGGTQI